MRLSNGEVLLRWPLDIHVLTQGWYYNNGSLHQAIDLRTQIGTNYKRPVYAAEDGTVDQTQDWDGHTKTGMQSYGNMVRIKHSPYKGMTLQTRYAHLSSYCVKYGQQVKEGDIIGYSGITGNVFGAHLHFEVILNGKRTNPLTWLDSDYTLATGKEYQFNRGEHSVVIPDADKKPAASPAETPSTAPAAEEGKTIQAMLIGPLTAAEAAAFDAMAVESGLADDRYVKLAVDTEGKTFMRAATLTGMDAMRMYALAQTKGLKDKYFSEYVG